MRNLFCDTSRQTPFVTKVIEHYVTVKGFYMKNEANSPATTKATVAAPEETPFCTALFTPVIGLVALLDGVEAALDFVGVDDRILVEVELECDFGGMTPDSTAVEVYDMDSELELPAGSLPEVELVIDSVVLTWVLVAVDGMLESGCTAALMIANGLEYWKELGSASTVRLIP